MMRSSLKKLLCLVGLHPDPIRSDYSDFRFCRHCGYGYVPWRRK